MFGCLTVRRDVVPIVHFHVVCVVPTGDLLRKLHVRAFITEGGIPNQTAHTHYDIHTQKATIIAAV